MDHDQKAKFILALHKHSLAAFDSGGTAGATQGFNSDVSGAGANSASNSQLLGNTAAASPGGLFQGVGQAFTDQNTFQAQSPYAPGTLGNSTNNLNNVYGEEQGLAGQLQTQAAGGGPNPAQQQYLQNSQNIAQQQANNYAANRSLNPGLAARMSGNAAANTQQNAASTAGIQQAQQQLAAQQNLGNLYGTIGNQQLGQQGLASQAYENAQGINAQVAQNNVNSNNQTTSGILGGLSGGMMSLAEGGSVSSAPISATGPMSVPASNLPTLNNGSGAYSAPSGGGKASGSGENKDYSGKSTSSSQNPDYATQVLQGQNSNSMSTPPANDQGASFAAQYLNGPGPNSSIADQGSMNGYARGGVIQSPKIRMGRYDDGGDVPQLASGFSSGSSGGGSSGAGAISGIASLAALFSKGGEAKGKLDAQGGKVKAPLRNEKAVKKDNSLANDKIPAMLSEGEIVLPREITMHKMAPEKAAEFVRKTLAKRGLQK